MVRRRDARIGLQNVRLIETPGFPVVYGDWLGAPGAPTILFYGHYDVQPVDPLDLWESPPFEATIRDGEIYARGAADDKGQVFMHLKAIEAHLKQNGRLPVNIKVMLEGEEEVGSEHLDDFIRGAQGPTQGRRRRDLRLGDVRARRAVDLLRPARPGVFPDRPARQQHRSAFRDLRRRGGQSGVRAGADDRADEGPRRPRQDPGLLRRCEAAAGRGAAGVGVACRSARRSTRRTSAIPKLFGETDYTTLERTWARPTLEVNGLLSGFTGEGAKTVLPAVAMAKISMRLVPDQDPNKIADLFEAYVTKIAPKTVELKVTRMHGGKPWMTSFDNRFVQAAGRAIEKGFGREADLHARGRVDSRSSRRFRRNWGCRRCSSASACRTRTRTRRTRSSTSRTSTTASSRRRFSIRKSRDAKECLKLQRKRLRRCES